MKPWYSPENEPSVRNVSVVSGIRGLDRQAVPGTARGACIEPRSLDHVLFWNSVDLERKLTEFKDYYHDARVRASLDGNTPTEAVGMSTIRRADISHITWQSHCHGLVQLSIAA